MIIFSVLMDWQIHYEQQTVSFLTCAIIVGSVFYYIFLHLQFVREHERDFMAAQRTQIMMTQIQPHFLFNTLNTIRALYAKDTSLADRTLENFSSYLRQNLSSLGQNDQIPITEELEHTRIYAEIEMLRFPNVQVKWKIDDEDFEVPALTVQPIVENAFRHGVRRKKKGIITISTAREGDVHRIMVQDNGVGFDFDGYASSKEMHIGIKNVKERIEMISGGTMVLRSEAGKGTSVTLRIPETASK